MKSKIKIVLLTACTCIATMQMNAQNVLRLFDESYAAGQVNIRTDGLPVVSLEDYPFSSIEGTDAEGNTLWNTSLGTYLTVGAFMDDDNNSIVMHTDFDNFYVTKLSATGSLLWQNTYSPADFGYGGVIDSISGRSSTKNDEDEYAVLFEDYVGPCDYYGKKIARFNSEGILTDTFSYCMSDYLFDDTYYSYNIGILSSPDHVSVLTNQYSYTDDDYYTTILNFTEDGSFLSQKDYRGFSAECFEQLSDGYLIGGWYQDTTAATLDEYLGYYYMRTDFNGDTLWVHYYPETDWYTPQCVTVTPSGNIVSTVKNYDSNQNYLMKFHPDGTIAWSVLMDPSDITMYSYDMAAISETQFAVCGNIYVPGTSSDAFLFLTDSTCIFPIIEIHGKAFYDENNNDIFDGDDVGLSYQYIDAEPGGSDEFTNYDGSYTVFLLDDVDEVEVSLNPSDIFLQSYPLGGLPNIVEPDLTDGYYYEDGVDFAELFAIEGPNVSTEISTWGVAPGFESYVTLHLENVGSEVISSGIITLSHPSQLTLVSTDPAYLSYTDTTITWEYTDLGIFDHIHKYAYFLADTSLDVGIEVQYTSTVEPIAGDIDITNNYDTATIITTASLDPNNKLVFPPGEGEDGNIDVNTESLEYTINFQNTGTSEAHFVILVDTFSNYLDISSIQMLGSSHQFTMDVPAPNVVKWIFNDINLSDSTSDLLGSMGHIKFRINIKDAATIGTEIENSAAIYFDYNPAVITNTTKSTLILENPDAVDEMNADKFLCAVFPNPASDIVNISFASELPTDMQYSIADITGKEIVNGYIIKGENGFSVKVEGLPAGLYHFILMQDNAIIAKTKFGVMHK
ncbi:MAG: T9SS type A sorting domain-containing protein [Fimbriimonadaceae bacterium]|nr:T9SS type A sorting domain-containing protein [Chitinophagales bacterium]